MYVELIVYTCYIYPASYLCISLPVIVSITPNLLWSKWCPYLVIAFEWYTFIALELIHEHLPGHGSRESPSWTDAQTLCQWCASPVINKLVYENHPNILPWLMWFYVLLPISIHGALHVHSTHGVAPWIDAQSDVKGVLPLQLISCWLAHIYSCLCSRLLHQYAECYRFIALVELLCELTCNTDVNGIPPPQLIGCWLMCVYCYLCSPLPHHYAGCYKFMAFMELPHELMHRTSVEGVLLLQMIGHWVVYVACILRSPLSHEDTECFAFIALVELLCEMAHNTIFKGALLSYIWGSCAHCMVTIRWISMVVFSQ